MAKKALEAEVMKLDPPPRPPSWGVFVIAMLAVIPPYGKPRAWNLQALQIYLQSIVGTKDFIYLIYSISFVTSHLYLRCTRAYCQVP
ncbi:hypothetical protein K1719_027769 [Acacia pycnantha]|nr:hypothetical protein K1719_042109 [Acacia pycnantha]KAI9092269.1 hypothetical protein K1719_027769 [Acacia pycnantha]